MIAFLSSLLLGASTARACDVLDYAGWKEKPGQAWDYRWPSGGPAKLTLFGAEHQRDPAHAQFARIAAAFTEARPTLAFYEGPDRGVRATAEQTIRETGESGYLRFLAREAGIQARGIEPSPPEQLKMLAAEFPHDQILLFFVLREATRLRDREGKQGEALEQAVAALLQKAAPLAGAAGLSASFSDLAGLQAAHQRYWPGRDWKAADARWFSPLADDEATGGLFAAAINRADSRNRNRHAVRLLGEAVKAGERPFLLIGRNHVPMQAPALDCMLRKAAR